MLQAIEALPLPHRLMVTTQSIWSLLVADATHPLWLLVLVPPQAPGNFMSAGEPLLALLAKRATTPPQSNQAHQHAWRSKRRRRVAAADSSIGGDGRGCIGGAGHESCERIGTR